MGLDNTVEVPDTESPLSPVELDQLKQEINPIESCEDHGIAMYTATKAFVESLV